MADELQIPTVPEPKPDDSEDVSWALSTAEAMWARGDHAEGIKWLRKAAEAASDAEQDVRALELAKAASDLASLLARRSAADAGAHVAEPPPAPPASPAPSSPPAASASTPPSKAPPARASGTPPKPPQPPRSSPPLPSKSSQPPPAPVSPSKAPRPPAPASSRPGGTAPRAAATPARADTRRGRRRSRENLDDEARIASLPAPPGDRETTRDVLQANDKTTEVPALQMQMPTERTFDDEGTPRSSRRKSRPDDVPAPISSSKTVTDMPAAQQTPPAPPAKRTPDWDRAPTQSLSSADLEEIQNGDRMTAIATAANKPASIAPPRPPTKTVHDEDIVTTQAVRVVVWRDANGVHVAPAGTVVSAITVDAVLVGLAPETDLTAWLSRRER